MDLFGTIVRREELRKYFMQYLSENLCLQIDALLFNREDILPIDKWNFLTDILKELPFQKVQERITELTKKYDK